jgi:pimeloyl-ACP methyl ester carboxylesterase
MYYEVWGQGEPVLLIMGITAPGIVWEKHAGFWKENFQCILADNRGVGKSDMPPGPYTSAQMADDYAGLLDRLGIPKVRVVGCSMGSIIAQQLALRHSHLVNSAVLMCTWGRCDNYARDVFQHMVNIKKCLRPEEFMAYIQLLIFSKRTWDDKAAFQEMQDTRAAVAIDPQPQPLFALEAQAAACMNHNVLDELGRIRCPCLVIGGKNDIFTPPWMAEEVAARIPNCDLHLYEGAGHAFHWECIEDFNPRVRDWLLGH